MQPTVDSIINDIISDMRSKEAKKPKLFKVELNMWIEINVNNQWVIGQIIDISSDGRKVWVETHEDIYKIDRVSESNKITQLKVYDN